MANCGLLLNDGTSFLLINSGDFLLLNDNTCATEPGVEVAAADEGGGHWLSDEQVSSIRRKLNALRNARPKQRQSHSKEIETELLAALADPDRIEAAEAVIEVIEEIAPETVTRLSQGLQIDFERLASITGGIAAVLNALQAKTLEDEREVELLLAAVL